MRIFLYIILLLGAVLGACENRKQQKQNPDFEAWLNEPDSNRVMYDFLIHSPDTLNTQVGPVSYKIYSMFSEYLCYPYPTAFHCYEFGDTALTCFNLDLSPSDVDGWISFVFINTPSHFQILSLPGQLPESISSKDFDKLMDYIRVQEGKLPKGRFIANHIDDSQEFTGWQYEFEKKADEKEQKMAITDNRGFEFTFKFPERVKLCNLPPFLFAELSDFAKICLPTLSDIGWCWDQSDYLA